MKGKEAVETVLIINLGGIGDILLSAPALKALRKCYPQAKISFFAAPKTSAFVKDCPFIDEVSTLFISMPDILTHLAGNFATLRALRSRKFDMVINMRTLVSPLSAFKMRALLAAIRPKVSAGRNTEGRGRFFDISVDETDSGDSYEMEYDVKLVEKLGCPVTDKDVTYIVNNASVRTVEGVLRGAGIKEGDVVIGIHPGGRPSRRWPAGNFIEAMKRISLSVGCSFVITGSADEASLAETLARGSGVKALNMAGRLSFDETAAIIKRCRLFICNDTSVMHIAAALKIPLVAIFGPGSLKRFDPRVLFGKAEVLYKKADCAPCNRWACSSMRCLKAISPQEVTDTVLGMLTAKGSR